MITTIQILSGLAILLAIGFIALILKNAVFEKSNSMMQVFEEEPMEESFISVDTEVLLAKEPKNTHGIPQLKEKLRQFKNRNRFYDMQ
jgi:hypothetical protein